MAQLEMTKDSFAIDQAGVILLACLVLLTTIVILEIVVFEVAYRGIA